MFSCNNAADAIDKLIFVVDDEVGLLLVLDLVSGDGGSITSPFISVFVSWICRLFFSLMMALSSELSVVLDREELCSCMLRVLSWALEHVSGWGAGVIACACASKAREAAACETSVRRGATEPVPPAAAPPPPLARLPAF